MVAGLGPTLPGPEPAGIHFNTSCFAGQASVCQVPGARPQALTVQNVFGVWCQRPTTTNRLGQAGLTQEGLLTFSFLFSSGLQPVWVGLDVDRPLAGPPRASPLRLAAVTLGGVMADAADVSGMAGRGPSAPGTVCAGGWWRCCGDTVAWGLRLAVGRRDRELWVRRGDTVAVGLS